MRTSRTRTRWRWWHVALLAVALAGAAVAAFLAMAYLSLTGGVDELFRGEAPRPGDPEVVAARESASEELARERDELAAPAFAAMPEARVLGGGQVAPPCQQGQHNWKRDDDFDLVCDLTELVVVETGAAGRFRVEALALHEAVLAAGWAERSTLRGGSGVPDVLEEYWDTHLTDPNYTMANLPTATYQRTVDGRRETLELSWAQSRSRAGDVTYYEEQARLRLSDGSPTSARGLVARITPTGYAAVLSRTVEYFRE